MCMCVCILCWYSMVRYYMIFGPLGTSYMYMYMYMHVCICGAHTLFSHQVYVSPMALYQRSHETSFKQEVDADGGLDRASQWMEVEPGKERAFDFIHHSKRRHQVDTAPPSCSACRLGPSPTQKQG